MIWGSGGKRSIRNGAKSGASVARIFAPKRERWNRNGRGLTLHCRWYCTCAPPALHRSGTTSVRHWCHTDAALALHWYYSGFWTGTALALSGYCTGTALVLHWYYTRATLGTARVPRQCCAGSARVLHGCCLGTALVLHRYDTHTLVLQWHCTDTCRPLAQDHHCSTSAPWLQCESTTSAVPRRWYNAKVSMPTPRQ